MEQQTEKAVDVVSGGSGGSMVSESGKQSLEVGTGNRDQPSTPVEREGEGKDWDLVTPTPTKLSPIKPIKPDQTLLDEFDPLSPTATPRSPFPPSFPPQSQSEAYPPPPSEVQPPTSRESLASPPIPPKPRAYTQSPGSIGSSGNVSPTLNRSRFSQIATSSPSSVSSGLYGSGQGLDGAAMGRSGSGISSESEIRANTAVAALAQRAPNLMDEDNEGMIPEEEKAKDKGMDPPSTSSSSDHPPPQPEPIPVPLLDSPRPSNPPSSDPPLDSSSSPSSSSPKGQYGHNRGGSGGTGTGNQSISHPPTRFSSLSAPFNFFIGGGGGNNATDDKSSGGSSEGWGVGGKIRGRTTSASSSSTPMGRSLSGGGPTSSPSSQSQGSSSSTQKSTHQRSASAAVNISSSGGGGGAFGAFSFPSFGLGRSSANTNTNPNTTNVSGVGGTLTPVGGSVVASANRSPASIQSSLPEINEDDQDPESPTNPINNNNNNDDSQVQYASFPPLNPNHSPPLSRSPSKTPTASTSTPTHKKSSFSLSSGSGSTSRSSGHARKGSSLKPLTLTPTSPAFNRSNSSPSIGNSPLPSPSPNPSPKPPSSPSPVPGGGGAVVGGGGGRRSRTQSQTTVGSGWQSQLQTQREQHEREDKERELMKLQRELEERDGEIAKEQEKEREREMHLKEKEQQQQSSNPLSFIGNAFRRATVSSGSANSTTNNNKNDGGKVRTGGSNTPNRMGAGTPPVGDNSKGKNKEVIDEKQELEEMMDSSDETGEEGPKRRRRRPSPRTREEEEDEEDYDYDGDSDVYNQDGNEDEDDLNNSEGKENDIGGDGAQQHEEDGDEEKSMLVRREERARDRRENERREREHRKKEEKERTEREEKERLERESWEPKFDYNRFLEKMRSRQAEGVGRYLRSFLKHFTTRPPRSTTDQVRVINDFLDFIGDKMREVEVFWVIEGGGGTETQQEKEFELSLEAMEKLVMNRVWHLTFTPAIQPPSTATDDIERDYVLDQRIRLFGWLEPKHLDLPVPTPEEEDESNTPSQDGADESKGARETETLKEGETVKGNGEVGGFARGLQMSIEGGAEGEDELVGKVDEEEEGDDHKQRDSEVGDGKGIKTTKEESEDGGENKATRESGNNETTTKKQENEDTEGTIGDVLPTTPSLSETAETPDPAESVDGVKESGDGEPLKPLGHGTSTPPLSDTEPVPSSIGLEQRAENSEETPVTTPTTDTPSTRPLSMTSTTTIGTEATAATMATTGTAATSLMSAAHQRTDSLPPPPLPSKDASMPPPSSKPKDHPRPPPIQTPTRAPPPDVKATQGTSTTSTSDSNVGHGYPPRNSIIGVGTPQSSRPGSRIGSRPASRLGSAPMSRQGSQSQSQQDGNDKGTNKGNAMSGGGGGKRSWEDFFLFAQEELCKMNHYKAPRDKMICVLNCCKVIFGLIRHLGTEAGADNFIPFLIFVVLKSNPEHLVSNVQFVQRFRNPEKLMGETGYYLSSLNAAISFVETMDHSSLSNISQEEFERNVEGAIRSLPSFSPGLNKIHQLSSADLQPSFSRDSTPVRTNFPGLPTRASSVPNRMGVAQPNRPGTPVGSRPLTPTSDFLLSTSNNPAESQSPQIVSTSFTTAQADATRAFFQRSTDLAQRTVSRPLQAVGKIFNDLTKEAAANLDELRGAALGSGQQDPYATPAQHSWPGQGQATSSPGQGGYGSPPAPRRRRQSSLRGQMPSPSHPHYNPQYPSKINTSFPPGISSAVGPPPNSPGSGPQPGDYMPETMPAEEAQEEIERAHDAKHQAALETLKSIFPDTEKEILEMVLLSNDGDLERTIDQVLEMS